MMKTLKLQLLSTLLLATLTLTGCKDECKDVTCVQGACVDGNCVCDAGYEGSDCSQGINAKLSGEYTVNETCTLNGQRAYTIEMAPKTGTTNQFILSGLYNLGSIYKLTAVMGSDGASFTIARQEHGSGFEIESSNGTLTSDGKTLTLTYTAYLTGSSTSETCTATLTR